MKHGDKPEAISISFLLAGIDWLTFRLWKALLVHRDLIHLAIPFDEYRWPDMVLSLWSERWYGAVVDRGGRRERRSKRSIAHHRRAGLKINIYHMIPLKVRSATMNDLIRISFSYCALCCTFVGFYQKRASLHGRRVGERKFILLLKWTVTAIEGEAFGWHQTSVDLLAANWCQ